MDADVVVVGYGPTGMAMAGLLGQLGYRVVVLERYAGLYNLPRAAIFDDETMRTLDRLGVAEAMLPKLHVQRNYEWCNAQGELLIEHDFALKGRSGWAEWYMMYQPELEDALDGVCRSMANVDLRFDATVVGVSNADSQVMLDVEGGGTVSSLTTRYVVACDGGNSATRQYLGVGLDDYGFSEPWMVCDFRLRRPLSLPPARQVGDPAHPTSIISLGPDHHRFSFMLDSAGDFGVEGQPDRVWDRVRSYLGPDDADLIRVATYAFRSLVALDWRVGRVLLAGDAAHQMPPFLGQGMCAGLRDAQNLAFKLDLILHHGRPDSLLDSYQLEREPHVRAVTEKAIELGRLQTIRDPDRAAERDRKLLEARLSGAAPEKLHFPGLASGMLAHAMRAGRGELSVQGDVEDGPRDGRFDEVIGRGFVALATASAYRELRSAGTVSALRSAGVLVVGVTDRRDEAEEGHVVYDVEDVYVRWLADREAVAVIVRPDFYVYGFAGDVREAMDLADEFAVEFGDVSHKVEPATAARV